jgi:hypothetical protein
MLRDQNHFLDQIKTKLRDDGVALLSYQWNKGDDVNVLDFQGMNHLTIAEVKFSLFYSVSFLYYLSFSL